MKTKVRLTVTVDEGLLGEIDALVQKETFESRSAAMETALCQLLDAQADAAFERALDSVTEEDWKEMHAMAEQGMADYAKGLEEFPWEN